MKETLFLGTILPTHPDFVPILQAIREKYNLPEIGPDDDPITEIYIGDEIVPLEEFRQGIENRIRENLAFLPPDTAKLYTSSKVLREIQNIKELELLPDDLKRGMEALIKFIEDMVNPVIQGIDGLINTVTNVLYFYLLTGEAEEIPNDWLSNIATITVFGEPIVLGTLPFSLLSRRLWESG